MPRSNSLSGSPSRCPSATRSPKIPRLEESSEQNVFSATMRMDLSPPRRQHSSEQQGGGNLSNQATTDQPPQGPSKGGPAPQRRRRRPIKESAEEFLRRKSVDPTLSQAAFAEEESVSPSSLSNYLRFGNPSQEKATQAHVDEYLREKSANPQLSQAAFANKCGLNPNSLRHQIERGNMGQRQATQVDVDTYLREKSANPQLSQAAFAKQCGISPQSLSTRILHGFPIRKRQSEAQLKNSPRKTTDASNLERNTGNHQAIKLEPENPDLEIIEVRMPHPRINNNNPILQDPNNPTRSITQEVEGPIDKIKIYWGALGNLNAKQKQEIHNQVIVWLQNEGHHESMFQALVEPEIPIDDGPNRGMGLIAKRDLQRYQVLGPYAGALHTNDRSLYQEMVCSGGGHPEAYYFSTSSSKRTLSSFSSGNILSYANTATLPNQPSWGHNNTAVIRAGNNISFYVTTEPIQAGEEVLVDYGDNYNPKEARSQIISAIKIEDVITNVVHQANSEPAPSDQEAGHPIGAAPEAEFSVRNIEEEPVRETSLYMSGAEVSRVLLSRGDQGLTKLNIRQIYDLFQDEGVFGSAVPKNKEAALKELKDWLKKQGISYRHSSETDSSDNDDDDSPPGGGPPGYWKGSIQNPSELPLPYEAHPAARRGDLLTILSHRDAETIVQELQSGPPTHSGTVALYRRWITQTLNNAPDLLRLLNETNLHLISLKYLHNEEINGDILTRLHEALQRGHTVGEIAGILSSGEPSYVSQLHHRDTSYLLFALTQRTQTAEDLITIISLTLNDTYTGYRRFQEDLFIEINNKSQELGVTVAPECRSQFDQAVQRYQNTLIQGIRSNRKNYDRLLFIRIDSFIRLNRAFSPPPSGPQLQQFAEYCEKTSKYHPHEAATSLIQIYLLMDEIERPTLIKRLRESQKLNPVTWGEFFANPTVKSTLDISQLRKITPKTIVSKLRDMKSLTPQQQADLLVRLSVLLTDDQQLELFQTLHKHPQQWTVELLYFHRERAQSSGRLIQEINKVAAKRKLESQIQARINRANEERLRQMAQSQQSVSESSLIYPPLPTLSEQERNTITQLRELVESSPEEVFSMLNRMEKQGRISNAILRYYLCSSVDELAGYLGWMSLDIFQTPELPLEERLLSRAKVIAAFEQALQHREISSPHSPHRERLQEMLTFVRDTFHQEEDAIRPPEVFQAPYSEINSLATRFLGTLISAVHEDNTRFMEQRERERAAQRQAEDEQRLANIQADLERRSAQHKEELQIQIAADNERIRLEQEKRRAEQASQSALVPHSQQQFSSFPPTEGSAASVSAAFGEQILNDNTPFGRFMPSSSSSLRAEQSNPHPSVSAEIEIHPTALRHRVNLEVRHAAMQRARDPVAPSPEPVGSARDFFSPSLPSHVHTASFSQNPVASSASSSSTNWVYSSTDGRRYPDWRIGV